MRYNSTSKTTRFDVSPREYIVSSYGEEYVFPPNTLFQHTVYLENGLYKLHLQERYEKDLPIITTVQELHTLRSCSGKKPTKSETGSEATTRTEKPQRRVADINGTERNTVLERVAFRVQWEKNYAVHERTGEHIEFRSREGLKRGWRAQEELLKANVHRKLARSFFITFTRAEMTSFNIINALLELFEKWLLSNWTVTFCLVVCEPHDSGSWHFHAIVVFAETPVGFDERFSEWAARHTEHPYPFQTDVKRIRTQEYLFKLCSYLDPTQPNKSDRRFYYPVGAKPFRTFRSKAPKDGENSISELTEPLKKPLKFLASGRLFNEIRKEIVAREQPSYYEMHQRFLNGELVSTTLSVYYTTDEDYLQALFEKSKATFDMRVWAKFKCNRKSRKTLSFPLLCPPNPYGYVFHASCPLTPVNG